jgi:hypothetical protein
MCGCNLVTPRISGAARSSSGSLAKFAAMRRGLVARWPVGDRSPIRLFVEVEIAERVAGRIADDERPQMLIDRPKPGVVPGMVSFVAKCRFSRKERR